MRGFSERFGRWRSSVLAVTLVAGVIAVPGVSSAGEALEQRAGRSRTTHLVTGDIVVVNGDSARVKPAKGREKISFSITRAAGRISVIPADAAGLIAQGRVDRGLFDVTGLIEAGYVDGRDLGVIITDGDLGAARQTEGVSARELPVISGAAVRAPVGALPGFWRRVTRSRGDSGTLWLDGRHKPLLDKSVARIGAPSVWQSGTTGTGVKVAVLDTGIDANHPDVAGRVIARRAFVDSEPGRDVVGHGTHVASTIAGTGAASDGRFRGVAPDASLLDGMVCSLDGCLVSAIVAGMDWAGEQGAKVINLSLGGPNTPGVDPMEQAVAAVTEKYGALVVAAAGNAGPGMGSVASPASAPTALAVGAVDNSDALAEFSGRGPAVGSGVLKPDVTAPGVEITAARSTAIEPGAPGYQAKSGTSMAAPHVAGAAALLAQLDPKATPAALKARLMSTATPNAALTAYEQGSGRISVDRAATQTVLSDGNVDFGQPRWPHTDDSPVTKEITYRNTGAEPVTLDLSVQTRGPDGKPAPAGMFTRAADSVTVPGGGTASVALTANTAIDTVDGVYSGRVTARSANTTVTTAFAVDREVESYDLAVDARDQDGAVLPVVGINLLNLETLSPVSLEVDGRSTIRLPKGAYSVLVSWGDDRAAFLLGGPRVVVDRDRPLIIDGRRARPISVRIPESGYRDTAVFAQIIVASGRLEGYAFREDSTPVNLGSIDGAQEDPRMVVGVSVFKEKVTRAAKETPRVYKFAAGYQGVVPTGVERVLTPADLATVRVEPLRLGDGKRAFVLSPVFAGNQFYLNSMVAADETTEWMVNEDDDLTWSGFFDEVADNSTISVQMSEPRRYTAGEHYLERWNGAVFGPWWSAETPPIRHRGTTLVVDPALFGDGFGHVGNSSTTGRLRVERDGVLLGELAHISGWIPDVSGAGRYRVVVEADRNPKAPLSTKVTMDWSFAFDPGDGQSLTHAPAWAVGFRPTLSVDNSVPAASRMVMPAIPNLPVTSGGHRVDWLTVDFSADDGRSWRSAETHFRDGQWWVEFTNPTSGFVSLRSNLTDSAGNTAEQTIIRAYKVDSTG